MRLMVTNDDGIQSPGLHRLAHALDEAGHEVVVVAPATDVSGCGTSVGRGRLDFPPVVSYVDIGGRVGLSGFAIEGTPSLAVLSAIAGRFGRPPDMVVSGINAGLNLGHVVVHSGTVGGALTAQAFGIRSMAVSLERTDGWHWDTAAHVAVALLPWVATLNRALAVNVNVPNRPLEQVVGLTMATLDALGAFRMRSMEADDLQFETYWPRNERDPHSDSQLVRDGYATVTALATIREVEDDLGPLPGLRASGEDEHG
jgi:5'-nucleotidase